MFTLRAAALALMETLPAHLTREMVQVAVWALKPVVLAVRVVPVLLS